MRFKFRSLFLLGCGPRRIGVGNHPLYGGPAFAQRPVMEEPLWNQLQIYFKGTGFPAKKPTAGSGIEFDEGVLGRLGYRP